MIVLLALVAAGKAVLYDTLDPDCFWHLRVADQIQRDGIGPIVDDISFASIKTPWTPYSWLAELGMKGIWSIGGYRAAIIMQALTTAAFVALIALCAYEMTAGGNPMGVIVSTVMAMFLSLPYLSFRPVTFVIVMLAVCAWLLLRDRNLDERSRAVWWIVPITAIATNCHFYSVLVPIWITALLIGAIREGRGVDHYGSLLAATLLACCATPMLPGMINSLWEYQFNDPMVSGGIVAEFQPFWTSPIAVAIVVLWLGLLIWNREKLRPGDWMWVLASLVLYMRLGRFAPIFAMVASPYLAMSIPAMSGKALARKSVTAAIACILVIGMVRIGMEFPSANTSMDQWLNRHGPDTPGYPTAAADFVANRVGSGRIINEFTWGGYLSWKLGDKYQVLLDGRTQLYTPQFWQTMYLSEPENARPALGSTQASAAILPTEHSRFRSILLDMGWQSAYRDDRAEVLIAPVGFTDAKDGD